MAYYLKCIYVQWIYPGEYLISFNVLQQGARNWCFVSKKDVIALNDREGLAKTVFCSSSGNKSLVRIIENYSFMNLEFEVPSSDIVKQ
ncbi:MAG: hypothetical protein V1734_01160 [Nanoarchaeota archaeon]